MKISFKELESPYFDGELELLSPADELEEEPEHFGLMQFDTPQKPILPVGWSDASADGKSKIVTPPSGSAGWNKDKSKVGKLWRIPLEELKGGFQKLDKLPSWTDEAAAGKAIALIPEALDPKKIQEVLLYFHGDGPGYRQANKNFCIFAASKQGCLEKGWVEDVETARIAQQLQSSARGIMAVLPQCASGARSEWPLDCDLYLDEIFDRLVKAKLWKEKPSDFRVILAGHSRGGDTIAQMIESRKKLLPSKLAQLTIFDAIHSGRYQIWALGRLTADLKKIEGLTGSSAQLNYLQASIRFRAYHAGPSYTDRHDALEKAIKGWFAANQQKKPGISTDVWRALRANYQVISAGHEDHFLVGVPMNGAVSEPPLLNALKSLPVVKTSTTAPSRSPGSKEIDDESGQSEEGTENTFGDESELNFENGEFDDEAESSFEEFEDIDCERGEDAEDTN